MRGLRPLFLLTTIMWLAACSSYRQNILFQTDKSDAIEDAQLTPRSNTIIEIGDYLDLQVFTKNGEKIIDPDFELSNTNINVEKLKPKLKYLVRNDGLVKVPMVGEVELAGLTLKEGEDLLQKRYESFYHDAYVNLEFLNKRVILLGSPGGKVIPLLNENTTLVEIIAQAEGINNFGKANNIRILRDDQVFLVDLSTIEGYRKGNVIMEPGDVVYIEPVRRPFTEFMKDNGAVISVFTSVVSLVAVLISIK